MSEAPFLRGSGRKDFKRCPQRYWWGWENGLRKKGRASDALWFGTGVHYALAEWYLPGLQRGPHPADTWLDWVDEEAGQIRAASPTTDDWNEDEWVDARDLGESMLVGYVDKYGADEEWEVIAPEESFQIDIPYRNKAGTLVTFAGTFDLVYRDLRTEEILLGEHKTAKQISTLHLSLDDQAGGYWAVASRILQHRGVLQKGDSIAGIMYNFLRKSRPDDRPENAQGQKLNKNGSISKQQPMPLFHRELIHRTRTERTNQLRRIQTEAMWMAAIRKSPDLVFKTPTRDCVWDCSYFQMCEIHEKGGRDWMEYRDAMYIETDPYADHRKSASE